ncbi:hypothetical protein FAP94_18040 [Morganella morganii]|nr:hypothetical protein [Morganella morganii]
MAQIGTCGNPILLVPESHLESVRGVNIYMERDLLFSLSTFGENNTAGLSELRYESSKDYFILNVISNSFMTLNETKIALFLHEQLKKNINLGSEVYSVSRKNVRRNGSGLGGSIDVGEMGYLMIGNEGSLTKMELFEVDKIQCLTELLKSELGISISESRLTGILRTLHRYSYITLTDINWYNSKEGVSQLRELVHEGEMTEEDCQAWTSGRSVLKHIRICKRMVHVNMSPHWFMKAM